MKKQTVCTLTFIPTSIGERCENGTSLVVNSQSKIEKLHISDARMFISSAFLCRAKNRQYIITFRDQSYNVNHSCGGTAFNGTNSPR